jgi:small conductance mechanosensitive channel
MRMLLSLTWADFAPTWEDFGEWMREHGYTVIVTILLAFIAARLIRAVVPRTVRPAVTRQMEGRPQEEINRRVDTLSAVIVQTARALLLVLVLFTVLPEFGIDIRAILAGVGIAGIALGLGAQTLVRDALNGLFILSENHYARGDVVTVANVTGTVEDVTLRRTVVRDIDGVVYSVPNSSVVVSANFTRDYAKVRVTIPVAASTDLHKVRSIADAVGRELARDPAYAELIVSPPTYLRVDSIDANGVAVQVNGTVRPGSQWDVAGTLRARLLEALQREGIRTPWG